MEKLGLNFYSFLLCSRSPNFQVLMIRKRERFRNEVKIGINEQFSASEVLSNQTPVRL